MENKEINWSHLINFAPLNKVFGRTRNAIRADHLEKHPGSRHTKDIENLALLVTNWIESIGKGSILDRLQERADELKRSALLREKSQGRGMQTVIDSIKTGEIHNK